MKTFAHTSLRIAHKTLAFLLAFCVVNLPVWAIQSGDLIDATNGNVNITDNVLTDITLSDNSAIFNWNSFDTIAGEDVNFSFGGNSFAALNRVLGDSATNFLGNLNAPGGFIAVVNQHGVVIGSSANISADGFVASSLDISNVDFLNGVYKFSGDGIGSVENYGTITAQQVALIGKQITNTGTISSPGGYTILAAGDTVYLNPEGSDVVVEVTGITLPEMGAAEGLGDVVNEGTIDATDGQIILAAGDTFSRAVDGIDAMTVAAESGGTGRVGQFGTLKADGSDGDGGSITLTAADTVVLGDASTTTANAGANGDGGDIVVYSADTALFRDGASVEAKGGSESGDGGFYELSGKEYIEVAGQIDMGATDGRSGQFLIDPRNIKIVDGHDEEGHFYNSSDVWEPSDDDYGDNEYSRLPIDRLENYLSYSNVTLETDYSSSWNSQTGWVWFDAGRSLENNTHHDLTVNAMNWIKLDSGINFTGTGDINLHASSDMIINAPITTGGDLTLWADYNGNTRGNMHAGYDAATETVFDVPLTAGGDIEIRGNEIRLGGDVQAINGNLTITGRDCDDQDPEPADWYDVWAYKTLQAGGTIKISATGEENVLVEDGYMENQYVWGWYWEGQLPKLGWHYEDIWVDTSYWEYQYSPGTIHLFGDVTAQNGHIKLYNDTYTYDVTGSGVTLTAGRDVYLVNNPDKDGYATFLQGTNHLGIIAGAKPGIDNGQIHADDTVISVTGSTLLMQQDLNLDTADYQFANQNNTDLTLISNEGSVTSTQTNAANAADEWASIGATAKEDITLEGNGSITLGNSGTDSTLSLWAQNDDIDVKSGYNVVATKDLKAGDDIRIKASHGILLQGATAGDDMSIKADVDTRWGQDVTANKTLRSGDNMTLEGTNVKINDAYAGGDMDIYAHGLYAGGAAPEPMVGSGDVDVNGDLYASGDIDIKATAYGPSGSTTGPGLNGGTVAYDADGTIYLADDVRTENGHITFHNNVIADGTGSNRNQTFDADGQYKDLTAKGDIHKVTYGDLTLDAGGDPHAHIYLAGDVTTKNGDLTLEEDVIANGKGSQTLNAGGFGSDLIAEDDIHKVSDGDLTLDASNYTIYLGGDVSTVDGDLNFAANVKADGDGKQEFEANGGGLTAEGYVRKVTAGDMQLIGNGTTEEGLSLNFLHGSGRFDFGPAVSTSKGNLWMIGSEDIQISGDVTTFGPMKSYWGYGYFTPEPFSDWQTGGVLINAMDGSIYTGSIENGLNVNITGNSDHYAGLGVYNPELGDQVEETQGRVAIAIVSSEDLTLGPDGSLNAFGAYYDDVDDRSMINFLDVPKTDPDSEFPEGTPREQGDAFDLAIYVASLDGDVDVDMSTQILSASDLMPQTFKAFLNEFGLTPKGAMVIDAWDSVFFGENFEASLFGDGETSQVGDRLEVVSRITEWLEDAQEVVNADGDTRLPYADEWGFPNTGPDSVFPEGYNYVLRGSAQDNPDIEEGAPAWVLELEAQPVAPLPLIELPEISGCPIEMDAAAAELGVNSDEFQVMIADAMATNPGLQPCTACQILLTSAANLRDTDGTRMAALAQIFNTLAPADAPFTPEVQASVATAFADMAENDSQYALAAEYVDAFAAYVAVLENDLKSPVGDPVALVLEKYGEGIASSDNPNIAAFIAAQMEAGSL